MNKIKNLYVKNINGDVVKIEKEKINILLNLIRYHTHNNDTSNRLLNDYRKKCEKLIII